MTWQRSITVLVSESGSGKTFVTLDLAAAVSGGEDWHGRPVRHGAVAYVTYEGDALGLRLQALVEAGKDLQHVHVLRAGEPLSPRVERNGQEHQSKGELALRDSLVALEADLTTTGSPPIVLLVLDTVRASMVGSEDRSEDVAAYLRAVRRLLMVVPEAGAILVHHAGWQDGETKRKRERGSSAFRGNTDAVLYLEVTADNRELGIADLTLTALKVRDDAKPAPLRLRRVRVMVDGTDEYARPFRTCRIETDPRTKKDLETEEATVRAARLSEMDQRAYDLIKKGTITSRETLRALLEVGKPAADAVLARLILAGRVLEPKRKGDPYVSA